MNDYLERRGESPSDVEQRITRHTVEVRSGGGRRIGGWAATFGHRSQPLPGVYGAAFCEVIDPHFFNMSRGLSWPGVVARFMHRDDMLLASTRSGTLQLTVDPTTGLDYTATLPECRSDVYELVQRGDIGESSFSFVIISANGDRWDYSDGMPLRTLLSGKLLDVAPVTQGAYSGNTSVGLRSLARYMDAPIEDVTDAVLANEVRRFFTRTDRQLSFPPKPASDSGVRVRATARQRQLEVLACRWETPKTEQTEQQQAVEAMRDNHITPLTVRQKQVEVMRQRWPAERRSGRSALLETLAAQDDWNE